MEVEVLTKNNLRIHIGSLQFLINHILNNKTPLELKTKMQVSCSMRAGALNGPDDSCLYYDFCRSALQFWRLNSKKEKPLKSLLCSFHFIGLFQPEEEEKQQNTSMFVQHIMYICSNRVCVCIILHYSNSV